MADASMLNQATSNWESFQVRVDKLRDHLEIRNTRKTKKGI